VLVIDHVDAEIFSRKLSGHAHVAIGEKAVKEYEGSCRELKILHK